MSAFVARAVLLSLCSLLLTLGDDAAHPAAEDAKPRGLKVQGWSKEEPSGMNAIRDFLDKADEVETKKMAEDLEIGQQLDFCIVNSWVAFNYLTQAFLEIDSSATDCKDVVDGDGKRQKQCAADIFGVLQCFFSTGGFVAGLVTQCANIANQQAQCAAAIVAWMGSFTELAQALLSLPTTCGKLGAADHKEDGAGTNGTAVASTGGPATGRRLGTGHTKFERPYWATGRDAAWCYLQINSALGYLAQAGVNMGSAARNCKDQSTEELRGACAADIAGLMSSLADVVSFIGGAASLCAKTVNLPGLCAGDVGTLANALSGLASSSASFKFVCKFEEGARLFAPDSRRLSQIVAGNHSVLPDGLRTVVRRLSDRFDLPAPDVNLV